MEYDYKNFETFFGIKLDEIVANANPRIISTSCKDTLFEYLGSDEDLPYYPTQDRFTLLNKN